jgi:hypothetical protein
MNVAWERWCVAVPDFSCLCPVYDRSEKFLRDASAGQRHAMPFASAIRGGDFIQPRARDGLRQFVGGGEGNQFKIIHETKLLQIRKARSLAAINTGEFFPKNNISHFV